MLMDVIFADGTEKIVIEYKTHYDKTTHFLVADEDNNIVIGNALFATPVAPSSAELHQLKIIRGYIKDENYVVTSDENTSFEHNAWSSYTIRIVEPDGYATLDYYSIASYSIKKSSNNTRKTPNHFNFSRVPVEVPVKIFSPEDEINPIGIKYRRATPLIFEPPNAKEGTFYEVVEVEYEKKGAKTEIRFYSELRESPYYAGVKCDFVALKQTEARPYWVAQLDEQEWERVKQKIKFTNSMEEVRYEKIDENHHPFVYYQLMKLQGYWVPVDRSDTMDDWELLGLTPEETGGLDPWVFNGMD